MDKPQSALDRAIEIAGSQSRLAELITAAGKKCHQQTISYWLRNLDGEVPLEWCRYLESAVGIPKFEFRPLDFDPHPAPRPGVAEQPA